MTRDGWTNRRRGPPSPQGREFSLQVGNDVGDSGMHKKTSNFSITSGNGKVGEAATVFADFLIWVETR